MRPTQEKVQSYNAARELLAQKNDQQLRYVALELRLCIEAVVYEKLEGYRKWISERLARTWQPPQAFKALLEIDPGGQDDAVFAIGPQDQVDGPPTMPLKLVGTDRRPKVRWLTDTWNKLGSDLHASWPYSRKSVQGDRQEFYQRVLNDLEPFVANNFTATMTNAIDFECTECGRSVVINREGLKSAGHATCLSCLLRYSHREENGQPFFFLEEPTIECAECHRHIYLPSTQLEDGYQFECRHCCAIRTPSSNITFGLCSVKSAITRSASIRSFTMVD